MSWKKPAPVIPGERCPATRTAKAYDPKVKITGQRKYSREGLRTCPRCGRVVQVSQSIEYPSGAPLTAWNYERHTVPTKEANS
ncbi:hypothetical protein SEA_HIRKO_48 [Arthrobacter phage Hirko]|nr:hypothetical protein SEA_HIRKO_48 [Arthrobacter phage Hirko]